MDQIESVSQTPSAPQSPTTPQPHAPLPVTASAAPRRNLLHPLAGITLVLLAVGAVYVSYRLPSSPLGMTLVWLTLGSIGLAGLITLLHWLRLQQDHVQPLARLTESIAQLAAGNHTVQIWGCDRNDELGEAARMAEKVRQRWGNMPDMIITTPDGPQPVHLNGQAASLFEALKQEVNTAVGQITKAAVQMQAGAEAGQAGVRGFSEQLHLTLSHINQAALEGSQRLTQLHDTMAENTGQLWLGQEQAVKRLTTVLAQLEQRSDGLNEIVRLTGQQTATTLQQLQQSGQMIRTAAQFNQTVGQKFASEADELSQRLFAAVNLLRSGGKVLSETNEVARSRMLEILNTMTQAETALTQTLDTTRSRMSLTAEMADMLADLSVRTENNASMMATAVDGLLQHNASLTKQVDVSGRRLDNMLQNVDALQHKFADAVATVATRSEQIEQVLRHLHSQHQRLMTELARSSGESANSLAKLAVESEQLIARIEAQLALAGAIADTELRRLGDATAAAAESAQIASNQLTQATQLLLVGGSKVESVAGDMAGQIARLDRDIGSSLETIVTRTDQLATHNETRLDAMHDKVEIMSQRLAALGQLTGTMGQVAAQLGQLIPEIGAGAGSDDIAGLRQDMMAVVQELLAWQKTINATLASLPVQMQQEMGNQFDPQLMVLRGQLEAAHQDMMAVVSDQQHDFGRRFDALEEVSGFLADHVTAPKTDAAQLASALRGIVTALSQINNQLHALDERLPAEPPSDMTAETQQVDQTLTAVTDIFSSLRDRGDNVISRLNEVANSLQNAADKNHR